MAHQDVSLAYDILLQDQHSKRQRTQIDADAAHAQALQDVENEAAAAAAAAAAKQEAASAAAAAALQETEYAAAAIALPTSGGAASTSDASPSTIGGDRRRGKGNIPCRHGKDCHDRVVCQYLHAPRELPPEVRADDELDVVVVTWNILFAAPDTGPNRDKLQRTLDKLHALLGGWPDAVALQETRFRSHANLVKAQQATPLYTWVCPPLKAQKGMHALAECDPSVDRGLGSWLLIRKEGPLGGSRIIDTTSWDDQGRVVAVDSRHGIVVGAYLPACCNERAIAERDGSRYYNGLSDFLATHRKRLLAVVGDLNMVFDACDMTDRLKRPIAPGRVHDFAAERALLERAGLVDAWRHHHPHTLEWSREDNNFSREKGAPKRTGAWARVDHVLVPARLVAKATATIHGREDECPAHEDGRSSDHIPVSVRVRC